MTQTLTAEQCEQLKCDTCRTSLCIKQRDGFEIVGHYNMRDGCRCVTCYSKNQKEELDQ